MEAAHDLAAAGTWAPTPRTYWVVPGAFLAGAYPGAADPGAHAARLGALFDAGCRSFVDLMEEGETTNAGQPFRPYADDLRALAADAGEGGAATHLRFPTPDAGVASPERMRCVLDAVDLSLAAGRGVYLHCYGGMGRTGTAVCCWMLRHGHADAATVFGRLDALRQADTQRRHKPAPETREQRGFVRAFAARG